MYAEQARPTIRHAQQPVKHPLNDFDKYRQPDIADIERRFVFDLVPPGQAQRVAGKKKVDWNLLLINQAMLGVPTFNEIIDSQWRVYLGTEERHTRKTAHLVGQTVDDA